MNVFQQVRLAFIDDRLTYAGQVNRSDLTMAFKVSVPQASKDISLFQKRYPGRMSYNAVRKTYRAATSHPVFTDQERLAARELANVFGNERASNLRTKVA